MSSNIGYLGNSSLKRSGVEVEFTEEHVREIAKCAEDPVYFIKNYVKIVNVDKGLVPFTMWPFQEEMVKVYHENRFSICKMPRQVGKCVQNQALIKIKHKVTNEIIEMEIGEFYERCKFGMLQDLRSGDEGSD